MFGVGSHSKKRPHNIVLGRTFDYGVLDMIELGAENFKAMSEFQNMKVLAGLKPCLVFNGPAWDLNSDLKRLKSLFTDLFHREKVQYLIFTLNDRQSIIVQNRCDIIACHLWEPGTSH